mmetsp:Transcript_59823/g.180834  ORF Transcript_59823/g.180834 Transcript_59823/m.180834 type:complete len:327 (-) Transcript_59823:222-1202(-)
MSRIPLVMIGIPAKIASEVTPRPPCSTTASTLGKSAPKGTPCRSCSSRPWASRRAASSRSASGAGSWPWPPTWTMQAGASASRAASPGSAPCSQTSRASSSSRRSPTGMDEKVIATTGRLAVLARSMKSQTGASSSSVPKRRKMKSVSRKPDSSRAETLLPSINGLIGTTIFTFWRSSSPSARLRVWMSRGQAPSPRLRRSSLSVGAPPTLSMTCRSTALKARPRMTRRTGPKRASATLRGSARGSISRLGCSVKPTMGMLRASERIIATCVSVKPKTMKSGRTPSGSSSPRSSRVAQWCMQPSLGKNSTSERESASACSTSECWP